MKLCLRKATSCIAVVAGALLTSVRAQAQTPPSQPAPEPPAAATEPAAAAPAPSSETPPIPLAERNESTAPSFFARPSFTAAIDQGGRQWRLTFYGFVQFDVIHDSTRSYADSIGSALVARNETYEGRVGRTQISSRNTRFGLELASPSVLGFAPSAVVEGDFFGNQGAPETSEALYFNNPTFRMRQAYLKVKSDAFDVLIGQTYDLFGWQNYFFPLTAEYLGLPNQAFGRAGQVRLTHRFESDAVNVDVAVAARSPAQRDSEIPDGNGGIRLSLNRIKGISTPGNGGTAAFPLSIGVSGTVRRFKVDAFTPPPAQSSNGATGYGVSFDALVPIIPARDADDRAGRLTLTGSFVLGTGIGDLVNVNGGATFPMLPNPALISPAPTFTRDIDNGVVTFDRAGTLHTIDWQTFMVGLQCYLPPSGRLMASVNFTEGYSKNVAALYPQGGAEINLAAKVAYLSRYADANVFFDLTAAVRIGASFQYTQMEYVDGQTPRNLRWMASALYFF